MARWAGLGAVVAVGLGLYALVPANVADDGRVGAPCPDAAGVAIFLLDLRKPLRLDLVSPGALVRDLALRLPPATELRVERITALPESPLAPVARLCGPRGTTPACTAGGWTGRAGRRDALYCARLAAAVQQVGELAATETRPVDGAYVLEAVEEAHGELARARGHRSLHIVSDMLQRAPWHSRLDGPDGLWDPGAFAERRRTRGSSPLAHRSASAEIFYVPRAGVSDARPARDAHQAVWRGHFAALGMPATFRDQPVMPGFATAPRRAGPSRFEQLSRQRDLLEADRVARDAVRQRLEDARARLAEMRARASAERAVLAERRAALENEAAVERRVAAERTSSRGAIAR